MAGAPQVQMPAVIRLAAARTFLPAAQQSTGTAMKAPWQCSGGPGGHWEVGPVKSTGPPC